MKDADNVEDFIYRGMLAGGRPILCIIEVSYKSLRDGTKGTYSGIAP